MDMENIKNEFLDSDKDAKRKEYFEKVISENRTHADPLMLKYFSNISAPVEYYIMIMSGEGNEKTFFMESVLELMQKFCIKNNYTKLFNELTYYKDYNEYLEILKKVYNPPTDYEKISAVALSEFHWKFLDERFLRVQEVKDGGNSILSFYFNPKIRFEYLSEFFVSFLKYLTKALPNLPISIHLRIMGPDTKEFILERIISGLNSFYNKNNTKINEFSNEEIDAYFVEYYKRDLLEYLDLFDYKEESKDNQKRIIASKGDQVMRCLNGHKEIISGGEFPPMMIYITAKSVSGYWTSEPYKYIRPTPLIDIKKSWLGDSEPPSKLFNVIEEKFFAISKLYTKAKLVKEHNELDKKLAEFKSNNTLSEEDFEVLEKRKENILELIMNTVDKIKYGDFVEKFIKIRE